MTKDQTVDHEATFAGYFHFQSLDGLTIEQELDQMVRQANGQAPRERLSYTPPRKRSEHPEADPTPHATPLPTNPDQIQKTS